MLKVDKARMASMLLVGLLGCAGGTAVAAVRVEGQVQAGRGPLAGASPPEVDPVGTDRGVRIHRGPKGVIHHSDQGSQYTSIEFGYRCREAGVRPSMGSVGDAYDNAMCESFFATLECELLDRRRFKTQAEARIAVFEFIEGFYNPRRRHSSIGYLSPIDYERHTANPEAHQSAAVLAAVKDKPFGRPQVGPSLTAAARDGRTLVPAGIEEWLRRGPNKRMPTKQESKMPSDQIP